MPAGVGVVLNFALRLVAIGTPITTAIVQATITRTKVMTFSFEKISFMGEGPREPGTYVMAASGGVPQRDLPETAGTLFAVRHAEAWLSGSIARSVPGRAVKCRHRLKAFDASKWHGTFNVRIAVPKLC